MPSASRAPAYLVVKLADIGDVLTATPALRALRQAHPSAHIDVLTSPSGAAVLAGSPDVTSVRCADRHLLDARTALLAPAKVGAAFSLAASLRRQHYDWLLLMHHITTPWGARKWQALTAAVGAPSIGLDNGRGAFLDVRVRDDGFSAIHEVEYCLSVAAACAASTADSSLVLPIEPEAERRAVVLTGAVGERFAVVHPGSGGYSVARRWPTERFAAVADHLSERLRLPVVLVGSKEDNVTDVRAAMHAPALDLSGRTDVKTLAALLGRCTVFVGNDSGVMHLACAAGAPLVAIFGPTDPRAWGPWRPSGTPPAVVVSRRCHRGEPCLYVGHSLGSPGGCPERDCLLAISVEEVIGAVERVVA